MNAIKGIWTSGQVVLAEPVDWPDGCEVIVEPVPFPEISMMTEEEQGDDPTSIAKWLAEFDAIPPLQMTADEGAKWQAWRQKVKDYTVQAVRRQMEEGIQ